MTAFERQMAMGSTLPCDSPMLLKMAATSARTACAASTKQKTKAKRVSFGMSQGRAACFD
jgi:hypothetical protein